MLVMACAKRCTIHKIDGDEEQSVEINKITNNTPIYSGSDFLSYIHPQGSHNPWFYYVESNQIGKILIFNATRF